MRSFGWKVLLPIAFVLVVVTGGLVLWPATANGFPWDRYVWWPLTVLLVVFLVLIAIGWYLQGQQGDSGGALRPAMAAYDVRHYALDVAVDPAGRSIEGTNTVSVDVVRATPVFE